MFIHFLNSLKTPNNASLIEAIQKGFRLVMLESITTIDQFFEMLSDTEHNLFYKIRKREKITFNLLPKEQYNNALIEFMKYGKFMRFPDKYILEWKELLLHNIAKLYILTQIHGHSSNFPFDTFYDVFDYNFKTETDHNGEFSRWAKKMNKINNTEEYTKLYNWNAVYEFMDKVYDIDNLTPQFTNGHYVLSDYATEPLMKLGTELAKTDSPEEIIVLINRILDVAHQRSDIAEIFIEGGSESLERISNS